MTILKRALSTASAIPALQNIPGAICDLLRLTARKYGIDVVLIDMSPSIGALNQCFLMGSDFFIVPTSPDYYCKQAISSLATVLPMWNGAVTAFRRPTLQYAFPVNPPKFLGIISQRYRPRSGNPAVSFQNWINIIKDTVNRELVPALQPIDMTVSEAQFRASGAADTPYNLINIADFNSLIAQSQKFNKPVFALTDAEIEQEGKILDTMSRSRDSFLTVFQSLATTIATLSGI